MGPTFRNARHFFAALADMAEELRLAIIPLSDVERARLVTRIVDESEMIFGVWPEPDDANGAGIQIIKGQDLMPPLDGFALPQERSIAAIPCAGPDQAIAARDLWGAS